MATWFGTGTSAYAKSADMVNRRKFIQQASIVTGSLLLPSWMGCTPVSKEKKSIGLQLYTLRDIITQDVKGTLEKVARIGYKDIEAYGYANGKIFGLAYADFNSIIADLGMKLVSCHYGSGFGSTDSGTLRNGWEQAVEDAARAGQRYMVAAWLEPGERQTIDDYKKLCAMINQRAEYASQHGVRMGYHNHSYEFQPLDGVVPYDVLLTELDDRYVSMELDLYWVASAGLDPLTYFERYPGRFSLWHVKDMDKKDPAKNADVGSGTLDFPAIFSEARKSGMTHFFIEQENYEHSPLESIENGFRYIKGIL